MPDRSRRRLPNRRAHELVDFECNGFRYTAGVGRFEDDQLAEIFLNCGKSGMIETVARDSAIVASIALQYGATPAELRHALTRNGDGTASGPIGTLLDILVDT